MGIEEHLPPGLPEKAVETYYRQAGKQRIKPESDEEQAQRTLAVLEQGESWHIPAYLNEAAHDARRKRNVEPLVHAIKRSRQQKP